MYNTEEWSPQQIDNLNKQKHPCFDLKMFVAAKNITSKVGQVMIKVILLET